MLQATSAPNATLLLRLIVGVVFLSEGIQKFLFADRLGSSRFAKIGLPCPEELGPLVGSFEIACGAFVLIGYYTRLATLPLLAIMLTAIGTTKLPVFMQQGFWQMAHDSRTDFAMLLGSLFLVIVGSGGWSIDASQTGHAQWKRAKTAKRHEYAMVEMLR